MINGASGLPRKGREKEYAIELWLDDPSAFFLHPEGPISDTTPEDWRAKQPKPKTDNLYWDMMNSQMSNALSLAQYQQSQISGMLNANYNAQRKSLFGLGGLFP